jgi:hypothetical protein
MRLAKYSGENRTGICVCGHSWEVHHLGIVMNLEYIEQTKESYLPQECEAFGFNEAGGMMFVDGEWIDHCHQYRDTYEESSKG